MKLENIDIAKINPWEDNPRINDHAVDAVASSISSFGFNVPILCNENLVIIAGHTRLKAAQKLGLKDIPVLIVPMNDTQRHAFSIADNKTAEIADWDLPKLKDILKELESEDIDLSTLGFSDEELRLLIKNEEIDEDEAEVLSGEPITKPGTLWLLDKHRLFCGDSRNLDEIKYLTDNKIIDNIFGGPPYYNQREYASWDNFAMYIEDMQIILNNCKTVIKSGGVIVWNIANECSENKDLTSHHSVLLENVGFLYLDTLIWKKAGANYAIPRNFHIKRNRYYYPAFQWEALLVFQKKGKMPKMTYDGAEYMSSFHTNVWEVAQVTNQMKLYGHPAVCPVEIPYRCIQAYSEKDAYVFEPFGGSGTTLIAAEKSGRTAFIMERNPVYCDQIVKRWEKITGQKANFA